MDQITSSTPSTKRPPTPRVLAAALIGIGLGVGGMNRLGSTDDTIAIESVSLRGETPSGDLPADTAEPGPDEGAAASGSSSGADAPSGSSSGVASCGGVVDRAAAERAALAYPGEGRVSWATPEDDDGAAWEIEVTLPDGREVDVYVDADGQVVRTS